MPTPVSLEIGGVVVLTGALLDTPAGRAVARALPFQLELTRWGDEYYGAASKDLGSPPGETDDLMAVGDLAYHGETGWFCLFFGPTPASRGEEPRAALPVIRVGNVQGDWPRVRSLGATTRARLSAG